MAKHTFGPFVNSGESGSTFSVVQYNTDLLRHPQRSSGVVGAHYSALALEIATGMQDIHHRAGIGVGVEGLARIISAKSGTFYVARTQVRGATDKPVGYAYLDSSTQRDGLVLQIDELEAFDASLGTERCRRIGAALVSSAATADTEAALIKIMGRDTLDETRPADFFTQDLGMTPGDEVWGDQGSYMFGHADVVLANAQRLLDV